MAATRMMSIIGRKNAGKTTLLVALAAELSRRKFRVMTIKHGTHPADTDQRGKDSWRHWHEGHAERVLMEGPGQRVLWERTEQESDPVALAGRYLEGADIVLVEGFKRAPLPKVEATRGYGAKVELVPGGLAGAMRAARERARPGVRPARPRASVWRPTLRHRRSSHRAGPPCTPRPRR